MPPVLVPVVIVLEPSVVRRLEQVNVVVFRVVRRNDEWHLALA